MRARNFSPNMYKYLQNYSFVRKKMKIDANKLKKALPLIKDYAENRGKNYHQRWLNSDNVYGNAISAVVRGDELIRTSYSTSYCYASLMRKVKKNDIILLQVQPRHENQNEEAFRHYIDWVVNYSPWRHAFISKNINRIMKDGVVVVHQGDLTKGYIREACIAVRMAWENYWGNNKYTEVDVWWELVQKVSPNMAYIAGKTMTTPKKGSLSIIIPKHEDSGHAPINYYHSNDNFHINGWLKEERHSRGWKIIHDNGSITRKIANTFKLIGKTDVIVNPFAPGNTAKEYKREAFIEAMHSELPKLEAEIYA